MSRNLRTVIQIARILPIVSAIVLLRVFAPLLVATRGSESVIKTARGLLARLEAERAR